MIVPTVVHGTHLASDLHRRRKMRFLTAKSVRIGRQMCETER
jgi:hypothetical protein